MCIYSCTPVTRTHINTNNTHTHTLIRKNAYLQSQEVKSGEITKKVINKTIKDLYRQFTPIGQLQTQNWSQPKSKQPIRTIFSIK